MISNDESKIIETNQTNQTTDIVHNSEQDKQENMDELIMIHDKSDDNLKLKLNDDSSDDSSDEQPNDASNDDPNDEPNTNKINNEKECFENEKKQKRKENLTVVHFFNKNYRVFIITLICLYFVSNKFMYGILTFILTHLLYYFGHALTHTFDNLFTKIHEYHHSHTNVLSHISQVLIELLIMSQLFIPSYFGYDITKYIEIYVLVLASLLYTTVHNINYGYFRVNNVHSIHHMRSITNYGPDLCDIIFGSKDILNDDVENISHYIPNMIILTILLMFVKSEKLIKLSTIKNIGYYFIILNMIFCSVFSIYLYIKNKKPLTFYNLFIGIRKPKKHDK